MDCVRNILRSLSVIVLFDRARILAGPVCDQANTAIFQEGVIGESPHFPWLGLLRVHLHHGDSLKIALTGLVMVKPRYGIANSDDIAKIPRHVFSSDTKAMFIPERGKPWFCQLKDYTMHPEYEYSTYNTIALVELVFEEWETLPFRPICWPNNLYNTSNELYAIGYTDENMLLEKMVFKLQYVKPNLCKEFYEKAGLSDPRSIPPHIQCGFAKNNKKDCTWENGMALASNSSGQWMLIGVSLRGPACSAPARFVDMFAYLPWIETATNIQEISDYDFRRYDTRRGKNKGKSKKGKESKTGKDAAPKNETEVPLTRFTYSYGIDTIEPFVIERVDEDAIMIHKFEDKYEKEEGACSKYKTLVYKEKLRVVEKTSHTGRADYRISIFDMTMAGYECVTIKVKALKRGNASLWYRYGIEQNDYWAHQDRPETPKELLKYNKIYQRKPVKNDTTFRADEPPEEPYVPGEHMEPVHMVYKEERKIANLNILIWFFFRDEATMELAVYGKEVPYWFPELTTTTTTEQPNMTKASSFIRRRNEYSIFEPRLTNLRKQESNILSSLRGKSSKAQTQTARKPKISRRPNVPKMHHRANAPRTHHRSYEHRANVRKYHAFNNDPHRSRSNKKSGGRNKPLRQEKVTRLRHHHNSGIVPRPNPYRLQKAILRQAERMAIEAES